MTPPASSRSHGQPAARIRRVHPEFRSINPITKTNWQGVGVQPDVEVSADEALETAEKLARDRLAGNSKPK